jgi:hypothetical protein
LLVIDRNFFWGFWDYSSNMVDTNITGGSADTNGHGGSGVTNPCGEHGEEDWTDELVRGLVTDVRINGRAVDGVEEDPDVIRNRMSSSSSNGRPFKKRQKCIAVSSSLCRVSEVEYLRNLVSEFQTHPVEHGDLLVCRGCRSVKFDARTTESDTDYCRTTLCKICAMREAHNLSIAADVGGESGM